MTIREHLEAIRDHHFLDGRSAGPVLCNCCDQPWPCFEREHAAAALAILDAAQAQYRFDGNDDSIPSSCKRLVPDPEPS